MVQKPFSDKNLQRLMLVVIVALAIAAGYFYTAFGYEKRRNARLLRQIENLEQMELESN